LAVDVTWGRVVANCVLVQIGWLAANGHPGSAIQRDTAHFGSTLPKHLCEMANVVEDIVRNVCSAEVRQHSLELSLVPALSNTGRDIEDSTRSSEKVLSLIGSRRDVVLELASVGSLGSSLSNGIIPNQWAGIVVSASSIVVIENCSLVLGSD
jgi:hypothetical protein